jgi:hypothetical protein
MGTVDCRYAYINYNAIVSTVGIALYDDTITGN